jgi:hypothetical protein
LQSYGLAVSLSGKLRTARLHDRTTARPHDRMTLFKQKKALLPGFDLYKSRSYENGLSPNGLANGLLSLFPLLPPPRGSGLIGGDIITKDIELSRTVLKTSGLQYGFFGNIFCRMFFKCKEIISLLYNKNSFFTITNKFTSGLRLTVCGIRLF